MKTVSVVISSRDEFSNIVHTVHAIVNDLETFLERKEWEIIIVDNCSLDERSWRFLAERGLYYTGNVKILHDPIAGNVTSRNKGAEIAQGKYLFFSDAHMSYRIGSFKAMIEAIDKTGGMVHPPVQWMGGYDPAIPSYQYTIKLGEKIWGTWNRAVVSTEEPFYIPVCGHCCLGMTRKQFLEFNGYNKYFRCYGGGEVYLDMKWWMLGSTVVTVPKALAYHLSAGRGYSYHQDDLIHNMMLLGLALGADAFAERVYLRYLSKPGVNRERLDELYEQAKRESEFDRALLPRMQKYSFLETLIERPWDVKNRERFGSASSLIGIYDDSWTSALEGDARKLFEESPLQKELAHTIATTSLKNYVYKGG